MKKILKKLFTGLSVEGKAGIIPRVFLLTPALQLEFPRIHEKKTFGLVLAWGRWAVGCRFLMTNKKKRNDNN